MKTPIFKSLEMSSHLRYSAHCPKKPVPASASGLYQAAHEIHLGSSGPNIEFGLVSKLSVGLETGIGVCVLTAEHIT